MTRDPPLPRCRRPTEELLREALQRIAFVGGNHSSPSLPPQGYRGRLEGTRASGAAHPSNLPVDGTCRSAEQPLEPNSARSSRGQLGFPRPAPRRAVAACGSRTHPRGSGPWACRRPGSAGTGRGRGRGGPLAPMPDPWWDSEASRHGPGRPSAARPPPPAAPHAWRSGPDAPAARVRRRPGVAPS